MSYLLDTCVVSYLRGEVSHEVKVWFSGRNADQFFISVVSIAEVEDGIQRLKPSRKKSDLEDWFYGSFQEQFQDNTLFIDTTVAKTWGRLNAKLSTKDIVIGTQDLYIAATALVHGLAIVTRNVKDFAPTGAVVINPWEAPVS